MSNPTQTPPEQDILPDYDEARIPSYQNEENIPSYNPEPFNTPKYTYHLRATKKTTSHLAPYGPGTHTSQAPTYEINYRSSTALSLFAHKPDITITHNRSSPSQPGPSNVIAQAVFRSDGPLPYRPRARLTINTTAQNRKDNVIEMHAPDWKNWLFSFNNEPYTWTFRDIPTCIELSSTNPLSTSTSPPIIARFMYGKVGTKVLAGGEVGTLEIWSDALTEAEGGREAVVAGCVTVVKYFDGLGRRYRNDADNGGAAASLIDARAKESTRVRTNFMLF